MPAIPHIPETAPFTLEQRAWLNGFLAGLFSQGPPSASTPQLNSAPTAALQPLLVLYGSQTGTAEGLAKRLAQEAANRGFAPRVLPLNDCSKEHLVQGGKVIIISSTWGEGDLPDNAANFWSWLKSDTAPRLEKLEFAILGLGDRNYADFCGASKKLDGRLEALGAKRLTPRAECDVDYEAVAKRWTEGLWVKLGNDGGAGNPPAATNGANGVSHSNYAHGVTHLALEAPAPLYSRSNPFPARLLQNVLLNRAGSAKEVRHYELSLAGSGLVYEAGDALGVTPVNCPELVGNLLAVLRCKGDESVRLGEAAWPLREALTRQLDITKPSSELLAAVTKEAPGCEFAPLLAPERAAELKNWLWGRDVLDILSFMPTPIPLEQLLPLLRKLTPRLYSVASSPKAHSDEAHLTVSAVRYESLGRGRKGVASTFLADRVGDADLVNVFVQPSASFKPPKCGDTPIIMVGPGTGIAPFRAFLEDRLVTGAKGKNWLFFGDQRCATDFLYEQQLTGWVKDGLLTRLDLAFSRDQAEKIYVQNRMLENGVELWSWLEAGAHFYVCGDAARMAKDVDNALHQIVAQAGGQSSVEATAYVEKMKIQKRYLRDVY
jgi:sulfite reductase (NADPH) flavoprotein alpha-component